MYNTLGSIQDITHKGHPHNQQVILMSSEEIRSLQGQRSASAVLIEFFKGARLCISLLDRSKTPGENRCIPARRRTDSPMELGGERKEVVKEDLVVNHMVYDGYSRSSLTRASATVKRQLIVARISLRCCSQAAISL